MGIIRAVGPIHCEFEAFIIDIFYVLTGVTPFFKHSKLLKNIILKKKIVMLVFCFSVDISFLLQILNCTSANYNPAQIILYLPFLPKFVVLQLLILMTVIYNHWCQSWITDCRVKGKQWLKCSCALQDIHKSFSVCWQILEGSTLRPWKLF